MRSKPWFFPHPAPGYPKRIPITEDHEQHPVNPYGESKLMVEKVLFWYARAYGLRSVALRYFNAAGADPDCELGEMHDPEPHLIPKAIVAAQGLSPAMDVYGTDYDTPDATAVRDYVHVTDLADAHVAALRHLRSDGEPGVFNLGTGTGHFGASGHFSRGARKRTGRAAARTPAPRGRSSNPGGRCRQGGQVPGMAARYSDLQRIVESAWNWHTSLHHAGGAGIDAAPVVHD